MKKRKANPQARTMRSFEADEDIDAMLGMAKAMGRNLTPIINAALRQSFADIANRPIIPAPPSPTLAPARLAPPDIKITVRSEEYCSSAMPINNHL